jgi:hypothetical protein
MGSDGPPGTDRTRGTDVVAGAAARLAADARIAERRRTTWLREQQASTTSLAAVLASLAEHRPAVRVEVRNGPEVQGTLVTAGPDGVVVARPDRVVLVPAAALAAVALLPGTRAPVDHRRRPPSGAPRCDLASVVATARAERAPVTVWLTRDDARHGTVVAAGDDVVVLGTVGGGRRSTEAAEEVVALQAVSALAVEPAIWSRWTSSCSPAPLADPWTSG